MDLVDQFRQYLVEDGKSPATIVSYVGDIQGFLRCLGGKGVEFDGALQRYQVTTYKKYLIEADYEVNTINKKMNSLVCFNHFLVQQGLMTEPVVDLRKDKVKVAGGSERKVEVYIEDEVDRILFYIHDPTMVSARDKLIITLLLFTGVRVSELVSIRLRDMDSLTMQLNVLGKGGKIREVPLRTEVIEAANEYMDTERRQHKYHDSEYLLLTERSPKMIGMLVGLDELEHNRYSEEDCGYVVILEAGDNVRDLNNVGLNPSNSGLLGSGPEYCEMLDLDGVGYYSLLIIYNNSFAVDFYTPMGCHDDEVEQWLAEQICFD